MTTDTNNSVKAMLRSGQFITAPGVFDLVSAKIADRTAAQAIYMTGYGVVASYLGQPDAGLATYTDMVNRAEAIADAIDKPLIADGDTGYGGLLNVAHTVRGYEKAGVAVIQIEDQHFPKKCGHTPDRRVVSIQEMVNKIKVASDARSSADFLILARTDALTSLGLDEALRRGEAYANAGADILFIRRPNPKSRCARSVPRSTCPCCPTKRMVASLRSCRPQSWLRWDSPRRSIPPSGCSPQVTPWPASIKPWHKANRSPTRCTPSLTSST